MPAPIFTPLSGPINGVNAVFYFPVPYTPGTVALYYNGQLLLHGSGNPWSESNPATGEVTITDSACIPIATSGGHPGEVIAGFALDTSSDTNVVEICELQGSLGLVDNLSGALAEGGQLAASLMLTAQISGVVADTAPLLGSINTPNQISGVLKEC